MARGRHIVLKSAAGAVLVLGALAAALWLNLRPPPDAPQPPSPAGAHPTGLGPAAGARSGPGGGARGLSVQNPVDGAVLPPEIRPPTFVWRDDTPGVGWWRGALTAADATAGPVGTDQFGGPSVAIGLGVDVPSRAAGTRPSQWGSRENHTFPGWGPSPGPQEQKKGIGRTATQFDRSRPVSLSFEVSVTRWAPDFPQWQRFKRQLGGGEAVLRLQGLARRRATVAVSRGRSTFSLSRDEVGAPLFYREVTLPFLRAVNDPASLRWRFGPVSSRQRPPVVMQGLPVCANCHSFSADGRALALDVDHANDKGSYAIVDVARQMALSRDRIITWSDYKRDEGTPTFGLLSRISPDGRHVASTVKDRSVFVATRDVAFSQLFFPIRGILAIYDRDRRTFAALPGADDPALVQSNPEWSPDGQTLVFARAKAGQLTRVRDPGAVLLTQEEVADFLKPGRTFTYDLYRVPFRGGAGGQATPLRGASHNGMSNFFPRYSPDGRWIVFCKARSFMLLQPDSELWIVPAEGGQARRLRANTGRMNSWHTWSPNGRWLAFSSKALSSFTNIFLTHIDEQGRSSPPVALVDFTAPGHAANIPEFVNAAPDAIARIREAFVDDVSYQRAAWANVVAGDAQAAVAALQKAIALNGANLQARVNLGALLLSRGELAEAERQLREAVRLDGSSFEARGNLGVLLLRQGRRAEAVKELEAAVQINPADVQARRNLERARRP